VIDLHKAGDFRPLVYKSTNAGKSWKSISGDLPERHIVWRLVQDTVKPDLLFLGTEFGIFVTVDGGTRWVEKAAQGAAYFTAPNPPYGAVFTYFLRDSLQTAKGVRQESEKELAAEGEDTPYPGWEELRREELEDASALILTVRDSGGQVVRQLYGSASVGLHRMAWDLRHADLRPETGPNPNRNASGVPVAPPGRSGNFRSGSLGRTFPAGNRTRGAGILPAGVVRILQPGGRPERRPEGQP